MKKKVRVVSLACDMPTGPPLNLYQIITLSQPVWELWPAQDLCFRGDNYITKKVRVVSLDMPTGPPLYFYQTLSKYVLGYQSYGLHKISASGEIISQRIK